MFGFNKKKEKKENHLDKVIMGLVVGGAIGSVLGVGLAPKKGSETRKEITKHTGQVYTKAKTSLFGLVGKLFKSKSARHQVQSSEGDSSRSVGKKNSGQK